MIIGLIGGYYWALEKSQKIGKYNTLTQVCVQCTKNLKNCIDVSEIKFISEKIINSKRVSYESFLIFHNHSII